MPQHQRWMASLADQWDAQPREPEFTSGDKLYGLKLKSIKESDDKAWEKKSTTLVTRADQGISLAQRDFVELRSIRRANVPFISAAPVDDRLDCLLASIEGPPDTPYEGGVFWITVKLVADKPPMLRFQTRVYHPDIDCSGKLCASYQEWWSDENLRAYMGTSTIEGLPWWSERRSNSYSLGAVLVALCGLLAHLNVEDPLVPEIAATYTTDYSGYVRAAQLYTEKYAFDKTAPEDLTFADDELSSAAAPPVASSQNKTGSSVRVAMSNLLGHRPWKHHFPALCLRPWLRSLTEPGIPRLSNRVKLGEKIVNDMASHQVMCSSYGIQMSSQFCCSGWYLTQTLWGNGFAAGQRTSTAPPRPWPR